MAIVLFLHIVCIFLGTFNLAHGWGDFPSSLIEESNFKHLIVPKDATKEQLEARPTVRLIIYDKVIGYLNWMHEDFKKEAKNMCSTKCLISINRHEVSMADVVIFHGPTHGKLRPLFPPGRPMTSTLNETVIENGNSKLPAYYGLFSMEQPGYVPMLKNVNQLRKQFDFMITYNLDTVYPGTGPGTNISPLPNLPVTYFPLHKLPIEWLLKPPRAYEEKTGYGTGVNVAIFFSNCKNAGAATRVKYVEELMKVIPIHSYGRCLHNYDEPKTFPHDPLWPDYDQKRSRKMKLLSNYKFYLAFENSQVFDYVSEKVFEGLYSGAVPVYRGASRISHVMPNNHSYVDANNMSPTELGRLLKELSDEKNRKQYDKFLDYKYAVPDSKGVGSSPTSGVLSSDFIDVAYKSYVHPLVACRICDWAYNRRGTTNP